MFFIEKWLGRQGLFTTGRCMYMELNELIMRTSGSYLHQQMDRDRDQE
jgi:hypothetical protein